MVGTGGAEVMVGTGGAEVKVGTGVDGGTGAEEAMVGMAR